MSSTAAKSGWQREQAAKQKQKDWEAKQSNNEHSDWMQKRDTMIKKKEEAELKAKQAEESAPEFLKKLGTMKENAQTKPVKKEDEGPTIEELDDGTDIPPWHRVGAPDKPEWVELLLAAAEREAQEEEEDEHVFVASGMDFSKKDTSNKSNNSDQKPKPKEPDQPEWMRQASNLRKSNLGGTENGTASSEQTSSSSSLEKAAHNQRAFSLSPKPTKATRPLPSSSNANAPNQRNTPTKAASKSASAALHEEQQPEWMRNAARIKMNKNASSESAAIPHPTSSDPDDGKPAWMAHASKLKQQKPKSNENETNNTAQQGKEKTGSTGEGGSDDGKPDWMKHKLKPRISTQDLQTSKVQEKLENKQPIRKASIVLSQEELTKNKVMEKLAKQPSLREKKAFVKTEEMEWMKQKLRPRGEPRVTTTPISPTATASKIITSSGTMTTTIPAVASNLDDDKPAWMSHKLKPRVSAAELQSSKVQEKLESKPQLQKSVLQISSKDLSSSKVAEKLGNRPEIRKSALQISSKDLSQSKVTEKLAQRPSISDKKSPMKKEEMEWMKQKLKPSSQRQGSVTSTTSGNEDDGARPEWMKKAQRRLSGKFENSEDNPPSATSSSSESLPGSPKKTVEEKDKRPSWLIETQQRGSFRGLSVDTDSGARRASILDQPIKSRDQGSDETKADSRPGWMKETARRPSFRNLMLGSEQEDQGKTTSLFSAADESESSMTEDNLFSLPTHINIARNESTAKQSDAQTKQTKTDVEDTEITHEDILKPANAAPLTQLEERFWSSMMSLANDEAGNRTGDDDDTDSDASLDESRMDESRMDESHMDQSQMDQSLSKPTKAKPIDFTASMNDIGAVLHGHRSGRKALPSALDSKRSSVVSKSRSRSKSKSRSKSRSRGVSVDKKKKKKKSDKDKSDKSKDKDDKDKKKKEKKKKKERKDGDDGSVKKEKKKKKEKSSP